MLISELFDAICWEISVESGSTDFQLVDDITDEWIIFCVFEHRFSMLDGLFIHCPWTIATGSFKDAHFATFPPALVEPCIRAGTSERGVCPECGAPWVRHTKPATTTSWGPSCECLRSAKPIPATVLDPVRAPSAWLQNAWAGTASQSRLARTTPTWPSAASAPTHRCWRA